MAVIARTQPHALERYIVIAAILDDANFLNVVRVAAEDHVVKHTRIFHSPYIGQNATLDEPPEYSSHVLHVLLDSFEVALVLIDLFGDNLLDVL